MRIPSSPSKAGATIDSASPSNSVRSGETTETVSKIPNAVKGNEEKNR